MIRGMTGYGKGECAIGDRKFTAELKSVNHRFNDITIKLPRGMAEFEDSVKKQLLQEISRGKTDIYISFETFSKSDIAVKFNEAVADALVEQLCDMKEKYNTTDSVSLNVLTRFPEILAVEKVYGQETKEICLQGITEAIKIALDEFVSMREAEGSVIKGDILSKLANIVSALEMVKERAPLVVAAYREKLSQRINELISKDLPIDENRLLAEVLLFADKSCINEEITRLSTHVRQMENILSENDAVGRKLDFLAQEMNREINTIGSKANDINIATAVVELKSELEKIREQIQNIE